MRSLKRSHPHFQQSHSIIQNPPKIPPKSLQTLMVHCVNVDPNLEISPRPAPDLEHVQVLSSLMRPANGWLIMVDHGVEKWSKTRNATAKAKCHQSISQEFWGIKDARIRKKRKNYVIGSNVRLLVFKSPACNHGLVLIRTPKPLHAHLKMGASQHKHSSKGMSENRL